MRSYGFIETIGQKVCSALTVSDMCYDSSTLSLFGLATILLLLGAIAGAFVPRL
ncbi:hypothetical protein NK718_05090 [Alsobacter sp. SYSU M60028]|uniref:Major facilitator superfamily (MFS) profile domain-containing protein n=1 Tax=Alsobacter ponti TaxID=2962936 RepID=A0ABT1L8R7_9HYPH|nr:hypothetical protein [Alsobacter ponti]MCP8937882.1 hypothetical protein [Alsobacter ponti]